MSLIDTLKSEAIALRAKEKASGRPMKHCTALEQVAKIHGYDSWRACCAVLAKTVPEEGKAKENLVEMIHYESSEWNFALDVPKRWNSFPPVSANSPYEVIRFASHENGSHLLIIFRKPHDPTKSLNDVSDQVQKILANAGFGNFSGAETNIGPRSALMLDFDKTQAEGTWYCRHYFLAEGTLGYCLGFGTTDRAGMFDLYDVMAKSFEILGELPLPVTSPK